MAVKRILFPDNAHKITYQQFLEYPHDDSHVEWVDGEVVPMAPVSAEHARVKGFLYALLLFFSQRHTLGEVLDDPFQMKTAPHLPGRAPDIMFVAASHLNRLKSTYLDGPADLVVEIISPESRERDRVEKLREYQEGGVGEYWLIDPDQRSAEIYVLNHEGRYRLLRSSGNELRSSVLPGFWVKEEWLWSRPPLDAVRKEWGTL